MPPAEAPLRIKSVTFKNFKSLKNFTLELSKFTCLIGLNGSGKSTVLQAFDFLSRLMRGNVSDWFEERQWKPGDLSPYGTPRARPEFVAKVIDRKESRFGEWTGTYLGSIGRCSTEAAEAGKDVIQAVPPRWILRKSHDLLPAKETASILTADAGASEIPFRYEGSILSQLEDHVIGRDLVRLKSTLAGIRSLELLSPENLRQRTRNSQGDLGPGGQRMAAFLHELGQGTRTEIVERLKNPYPNLESLDAKTLRSGWKQLEIVERFGEREVRTPARHASDGMLRLIAIAASLYREQSCLLFDEIENGINPELAEFVVDVLLNAPAQVIVTTHSPLFLNWLPDEVARKSVMYLFRTEAGETKVVPFFEIPSMRKKLEVMGPGEAYVDTNLHALEEELRQLPEVPAR